MLKVLAFYLGATEEDLESASAVQGTLHHIAKKPGSHAKHKLFVSYVCVETWGLHAQRSKQLVAKDNKANEGKLQNHHCLPQRRLYGRNIVVDGCILACVCPISCSTYLSRCNWVCTTLYLYARKPLL